MRVRENVYMSASTHGRTYIVRDVSASGEETLVMIDAFTADGVRVALDEFETQDGLDLSRLRALLLTHLHYDHAGGAAYIRAAYGVPVVCHPLAADAITRGDRIMTAAEIRFQNVSSPVPRCTIDYLVDEGDTLEIGPLSFDVIHLPGHSPGGVGYVLDGLLFCGDTMLPGGRIGWSDVHWGSNLVDHVESIRRLKQMFERSEAPIRMFHGGHDMPEELTADTLDTALENVRKLVQVGLPSSVSERAPRRGDDDPPRTVAVAGQPEVPAVVPENYPTKDLRDAAIVQATSGDLEGFIRPIGHMHGLILSARGTPITQPFQATMNLEHYCERARGSRFAPRTEVAQTYEIGRDSVTVHFARHPDWAVTSAVRYTRRDDAVFDILFTFDFEAPYTRFEAFIASYFYGRTVPFVAAGGNVFRPEIEHPSQLFFPRDGDTCEQVSDGRWQFLADFKLRGDTYEGGMLYDAPITIHRPDDAPGTFIQMVDRRECAAVSANRFAFAQDFSLVGRDVEAGERVEVPARVMYRDVAAPEEAVALWREWQAELEAAGR